PAPSIALDDRNSWRLATEHLLELGHRRIGIVTGNLSLPAGAHRLQGYQAALEGAGIEVESELVGHGNFRFEAAHAATHALLDLERPPSALLLCSELMTGAAL